MLKKIFILLLPFFLFTHLHAQEVVTTDTFSTRYFDSGSLTKQKLAAVNEKSFLFFHPGFNNIFSQFPSHLKSCFVVGMKMNSCIEP